MSLRDEIEADAVRVFLNADDFAESVTYHPHRFGADAYREPRAIVAVVFRESFQTLGEDETVVPMFMVHVANNATTGISSDEIDLGGDRIEFPPRDGQPAQRRTITRILTQDHGMMELECR
jgi:hypothetical protein